MLTYPDFISSSGGSTSFVAPYVAPGTSASMIQVNGAFPLGSWALQDVSYPTLRDWAVSLPRPTTYFHDTNNYVLVSDNDPDTSVVNHYISTNFNDRTQNTTLVGTIRLPKQLLIGNGGNKPMVYVNVTSGKVLRINGATRIVAGGSFYCISGYFDGGGNPVDAATHGGSFLSATEVGLQEAISTIPHKIGILLCNMYLSPVGRPTNFQNAYVSITLGSNAIVGDGTANFTSLFTTQNDAGKWAWIAIQLPDGSLFRSRVKTITNDNNLTVDDNAPVSAGALRYGNCVPWKYPATNADGYKWDRNPSRGWMPGKTTLTAGSATVTGSAGTAYLNGAPANPVGGMPATQAANPSGKFIAQNASIAVSAGVATATVAIGANLSGLNVIEVAGFTGTGSTDLNGVKDITVNVGANTFSFNTTAPNGTYTGGYCFDSYGISPTGRQCGGHGYITFHDGISTWQLRHVASDSSMTLAVVPQASDISFLTGGTSNTSFTTDRIWFGFIASGWYGGPDPDIVMGSYFAIPKNVTAASLGLQTSIGQTFLTCLKTKGAVAVDDPYSNFGGFEVSAEFAAAYDLTQSANAGLLSDMQKLYNALQYVAAESPVPTDPSHFPGLITAIDAGHPKNTVSAGIISQAYDLSGNGNHWNIPSGLTAGSNGLYINYSVSAAYPNVQNNTLTPLPSVTCFDRTSDYQSILRCPNVLAGVTNYTKATIVKPSGVENNAAYFRYIYRKKATGVTGYQNAGLVKNVNNQPVTNYQNGSTYGVTTKGVDVFASDGGTTGHVAAPFVVIIQSYAAPDATVPLTTRHILYINGEPKILGSNQIGIYDTDPSSPNYGFVKTGSDYVDRTDFTDLSIGQLNPTDYTNDTYTNFEGYQKCVYVWNRALSPTECQQLTQVLWTQVYPANIAPWLNVLHTTGDSLHQENGGLASSNGAGWLNLTDIQRMATIFNTDAEGGNTIESWAARTAGWLSLRKKMNFHVNLAMTNMIGTNNPSTVAADKWTKIKATLSAMASSGAYSAIAEGTLCHTANGGNSASTYTPDTARNAGHVAFNTLLRAGLGSSGDIATAYPSILWLLLDYANAKASQWSAGAPAVLDPALSAAHNKKISDVDTTDSTNANNDMWMDILHCNRNYNYAGNVKPLYATYAAQEAQADQYRKAFGYWYKAA